MSDTSPKPPYRAGLLAFGGNVALPLSALITAPLLAQGLGAAARGEVAAVVSAYTLLVMLTSAGLADAVTYFVARRLSTFGFLGRSTLLICSATAIISIALAYLSAPALAAGSVVIEDLIRLTSWLVFPAVIVSVVRGFAAGRNQWGLIAAEKGTTALVRVGGIAFLLATGTMTAGSASMVLVLSLTAAGVPYLLLLAKEKDGGHDQTSFRELTGYASKVWLGAVAGVLLSRVDQILLAPMAGTKQLGLYAVAVNIGDVPLIIVATFVGLMLTADAKSRNDARLALTSRATSLLVFLAGSALTLSMPLWLTPLFGDEFISAMPVAAILLLAVLIQAPGSVAGAGLSARGTPHGRSNAIAFACLANVAALLLLAPGLGAIGAAVATVIGLSTNTFFNLFYLKRWHNVKVGPFFGLRRGDLTEMIKVFRR
ncbi:oligosaccharide flippase family protein [Microbacterium sp. NPDC091382]|uniref:oligosaccharide flippase family protein n=1 Tax=Microbacterium sp. NPDC091382 TaxID=3364210 RepID=UPI003808750C